MDKGYSVPNVAPPIDMPTFNPNVTSKLQVFISNYFLESIAHAYFQKNIFTYTIEANTSTGQNKIAPFDTNTLEAVFPFITMKFGKKMPTDVTFSVLDLWGVNAFATNYTFATNLTGRIVAHMKIEASAIIRYPSGESQNLGTAQFHDTVFSAYVNQTNNTNLSTWLHSCNASEMWLDTTYLDYYRSSAYVINLATAKMARFFNYNYLANMMIDLNNLTMGIFKVQDANITYCDGYLELGFTADFSNTTFLKSGNPQLE